MNGRILAPILSLELLMFSTNYWAWLVQDTKAGTIRKRSFLLLGVICTGPS